MHGLGNDFVLFDATRDPLRLTPEQARRIADRHFGIGCDQILLAEPRAVSEAAVHGALTELRAASVRYDREALAEWLHVAVPEFSPVGPHASPYAGTATVVAFPARNARKI